jgi:signal transduction histidine kinase/CheY-like chemotaxis protein
VTGSLVGFYHFVEADQRTLSLQAWSTRTVNEFCTALGAGLHYSVADAGVWADCVPQRRAIIHNDYASLPHRKGLPHGHAPVIRELVVPIFREDKIVAILGVGNKATDYTDSDVSTVAYLADGAWEIAERKRTEQERAELQARLAQSQKMEAIGTLAGGIAHDFNNILGGVLGGLSMLDLELGERAGPYHQDIHDMKALVQRGAELTRQLLGFARRDKHDAKPLDLARVVDKTSALFGRTRKDITLQLELATGLLPVLMDHAQLEQVLLNLFVNAGQAMPEGGQLRLRAENTELSDEQVQPHGVEPGPFVKLVVADTGMGMDSATRERIFEPFFTTKAPGEGTGLGLASVYGIIKSHAGFITVDSELGAGTTFTLYLPATDSPPEEEESPAISTRLGKGTVLVVDDEERLLKVYARLLRRIGYDVLTASSGKQAVELVRQHGDTISLVILDMIMPQMSGRQTYEALRAIAPNIKVLLASGYSIDGQAQDILERGCNGFIEKPFDASTLSKKVRELM